MSGRKLWFCVGAMFFSCVSVLFVSQYDEWFVFPSKRAFINNNLKDPSSTQYRNERMTKSGWLCGELNAKNGNGAYAGFKRFAAGSADDAYLEGEDYIGIGPGASNRVASTDFILARLQVKIEMQENFKKLREIVPDAKLVTLSEREVTEKAAANIFEEKWNAVCAD
jgi:hypothetical protein